MENNKGEVIINFKPNSSIAIYDIENDTIIREIVDKQHWIFQEIEVPFDYYFHEDLLIIPTTKSMARGNWSDNIFLKGQELICLGKYIAFFHIDRESSNGIIIATSVTLPEFEYIKENLYVEK